MNARKPSGRQPVPLTAYLVLDIDPDRLLESVLEVGGRALLIAILAFLVVQLIKRTIGPVIRVTIREQMAGEPEIEVAKRIDTLSHVVYNTAVAVVTVVAVITVLPEFGVNAGPLIAGLGLVGLAVGFGAQNLVRDLINGLFILLENQYAKGDVVSISGTSGLVEDLNLRRTVLRDLDGIVHFIPHSNVTTASNFTKGYSRVNFNIGVAYESDIDHVFEVINRVGLELAEDPEFGPLIKEAPHALRVDAFGDSAIEVKILGETQPIQQWTVMGELRKRLKSAFDREGIVIPFPQRTIHGADGVRAAEGPQDRAGESGLE